MHGRACLCVARYVVLVPADNFVLECLQTHGCSMQIALFVALQGLAGPLLELQFLEFKNTVNLIMK